MSSSIIIIHFTAGQLFMFWPHHAACRILVPQPRIEPVPPTMEVRSLNNWTTGKVLFLNFNYFIEHLFQLDLAKYRVSNWAGLTYHHDLILYLFYLSS